MLALVKVKVKNCDCIENKSELVQLATHVPDTVIMRSPNAPIPDTHNSYGVVMFLDISGII